MSCTWPQVKDILVASWTRVGSLTSWSRTCSLHVSRKKLHFVDSVVYGVVCAVTR